MFRVINAIDECGCLTSQKSHIFINMFLVVNARDITELVNAGDITELLNAGDITELFNQYCTSQLSTVLL